MPTYDYRCNACGHKFELFQSMTAKPLKVCPQCGKKRVERLIGTGAALLFKGSGFYQTDYRSDSYTKGSDAEKKASEPKPESKPDTKPDTKADTKPQPKAEAKPAASPAKPAGDKPKPAGKKSRA